MSTLLQISERVLLYRKSLGRGKNEHRIVDTYNVDMKRKELGLPSVKAWMLIVDVEGQWTNAVQNDNDLKICR